MRKDSNHSRRQLQVREGAPIIQNISARLAGIHAENRLVKEPSRAALADSPGDSKLSEKQIGQPARCRRKLKSLAALTPGVVRTPMKN